MPHQNMFIYILEPKGLIMDKELTKLLISVLNGYGSVLCSVNDFGYE